MGTDVNYGKLDILTDVMTSVSTECTLLRVE